MPQSIPQRPTRSKPRNSEDSHLVTAITSKLEESNFRAAIRLLCSKDKPAPNNAETLEVLQAKHPPAAQDRKSAYDFVGNAPFQPLPVSPEDVIKCLGTFQAGTSGGPDGFTAQNVRDILAGAPDEKLKTTVSDFIKVTLNGELPQPVKEILFCGGLIALHKKDEEFRPIAVGNTLSRLADRCANSHVIQRRSEELQPVQWALAYHVVPKQPSTPSVD